MVIYQFSISLKGEKEVVLLYTIILVKYVDAADAATRMHFENRRHP